MARKRWDIEVTAEDLDFGEMRDSNRCAVQRAVARKIPKAKRVEVDLQTVRFSLDGDRHVFLTPWQVAEYVIAFDAGDRERIGPFSFQLRAPVEIGSQVRRRPKSEAGKKMDAAQDGIRRAKTKKRQAQEVIASPAASATETETAEQTLAHVDGVIAERERNYQELREAAQASGETWHEPPSDTDKPKAPRKFKTRHREYGRRVLRVNQEDGRTHVHN